MSRKRQKIAKVAEVDVCDWVREHAGPCRAIHAWVGKSLVLYWLDLGNSAATGKFVLGQPDNRLNQKKKCRLQTVAELYLESLRCAKTMTGSFPAVRLKR